MDKFRRVSRYSVDTQLSQPVLSRVNRNLVESANYQFIDFQLDNLILNQKYEIWTNQSILSQTSRFSVELVEIQSNQL